jgi:hypothetical protein
MNINHKPILDVKKAEAHYSEQDGVPVKYVCTTELKTSDIVYDVFYRETPHPEFGNRYFGLRPESKTSVLITNADVIEELDFGMIEDSEGVLHYSQNHHDYNALENKEAVDGGRQYIRRAGKTPTKILVVKDGEFVEKE